MNFRVFILLCLCVLFLVDCGHPRPLGNTVSFASVQLENQSLLSWCEVVALFGIGVGVFIGVLSHGLSTVAMGMIAGNGAVLCMSILFKYLDPCMPYIVGTMCVGGFVWLGYKVWHMEHYHLTVQQEFAGAVVQLATVKAQLAVVAPLLQEKLQKT